jgi:hypothetical protein
VAGMLRTWSCTFASVLLSGGVLAVVGTPSTASAAAPSWSIVSSPSTSATQANNLNGVSCISASDCTAVGDYFNGTYRQTLIERWNGTSWSIVSSPNVSATDNNLLLGVSCFSASACTAVGDYYLGSTYQTLIEQWNGTSWSIASSPDTSATQINILRGVSCTSASSCTAVGYYVYGSASQTLIEQLSGSTWSIVTSADTSSTQVNQLLGVSCTSASSCTAVGEYYTSPYDQTLIEQLSGTTWSIVTSADTSAAQSNDLAGVSCMSATACTAVGDYYTGSYDQTLIEQLSGTTWSVVSSPNTSASQSNQLLGISCTSASACTAAGQSYTGTYDQTLIEQLSGTTWSLASSPDTSTTQTNEVPGVSCTSASVCTAVGEYENTVSQTLIEMLPALPVVSSVSPTRGLATGGTTVTIDGANLTGATSVQFGTVASPSFSVTSDTTITAQSPRGVPGTVDITVTSPRGTSATSSADQFTYQTPGYDLAGSDGGVFVFPVGQSSGFYGSLPGLGVKVNNIVGIVPTNNFTGYDLVGSDGGVFVFPTGKSSGFFGSLPGIKVSVSNVVGIVPTNNYTGYDLVGSDGGVFVFPTGQSSGYYGSLPGKGVSVSDIVGIVASPGGGGYFLVGRDGGVFTFGNAPFLGSLPGIGVSVDDITGIASTPDGKGYYVVGANGSVYAFGDAVNHGTLPGHGVSVSNIVSIVPTPDGGGYWLIGSDGGVFAFGDATSQGSLPGLKVTVSNIVGAVPTE